MGAPTTGLRIVTMNFLPPVYQLVARWAAQMGHTIVLVVTTPGPPARPTPMYADVVAMATANRHETLVTTRMRRTAAPVIAALRPDIVLSGTFPYRLPPEITSIPRMGAVNLHPTPLPTYRGPNPVRAIYDGAPTLGATLHRTESEFDTGPILSKKEAPMPAVVTPAAILAVWPGLWYGALAEGMERLIAGEPGERQDESNASYGAQFTEADAQLDWREPMAVLQRRSTALNMVRVPGARAEIDGRAYRIERVEPATEQTVVREPGTILQRTDDGFLIAVGDGVAHVAASALN
jgi:methionyl-tRNA formyltransferase